MASNTKMAVIGIGFAVLAIGGYQLAYREGMFRPTSSTRQVLNDALGRADRANARLAQAKLDALLARSENGEPIDMEELKKAVHDATNGAEEFDKLWRDVEAKTRGKVTEPPPPVQTLTPSSAASTTSIPAAARPAQTAPSQPPGEVSKPLPPPRDSFFDTELTVSVNQSWQRLPGQPEKPYGLRVGGLLKLDIETSDQRHEVGPAGIDLKLVSTPAPLDHRPSVGDMLANRTRAKMSEENLISPDSKYGTLIGRFCDSSGCDKPFAYRFRALADLSAERQVD